MTALYLDEQTRGWLERKAKVISETDFVGRRVQEMLKADRQRLDEIAKCDHHATHYVGEKICCGRCGSFYEKGMGQSWTMANPQQFPQPTPPKPNNERKQ